MTEHKNIYSALCAAQAEFGKVQKGSTNPAFKSRYADLADVAGVVIPTLSAHGVAVLHYMTGEGDQMAMRTEFVHAASESRVACDVPLIVDRNNMQGMKSATTYAKRIGLESLSGVAPDTDDDGNAAAKAPPSPRQQPPAKINAEKFQEIINLIEHTASDEAKLCAYWKVSELHELTAQQADQTIAMLTKKLGAE
jgi:transposase